MIGGVELRPVLPALVVAITGVVVLLAQAFAAKGSRAPSVPLSLAGLALALYSTASTWSGPGRGSVLGGSVAADDFALLGHAVILSVGLLVVLLSQGYLRALGQERGEYYALVLFSVVGMLGLVSALELISLFVALEIMSVALYALAGLRRDRPESQESAIKYFVTGAFASAFFLYGVAILYGVSGSTSLAQIGTAVAERSAGSGPLVVLGAGLLLVGFGFKVAAVPFHMWAPDVYEGAPTTVTAFMAAGVKVAAFAALLRVFAGALASAGNDWQPAVAVLAALTMIVGNLGALAQSSIKRMLAYSSIAHAGYLMTGLVAQPVQAGESVLFYLVGYAAVNLGTFGAIAALSRRDAEPLTLADFAGLGERRPVLAAALTVFLISLTGVPVSAGFVGKFYLFSAAVRAGYAGLAVVGVLMSVVSAYYYLRVVVAMYMEEAQADDRWSPLPAAAVLALAVCVAVVLALGVYPGPVLMAARLAGAAL
ncbi:MAG: NADH-quinone oxidoreductase subunit N [Vicinamibacteria bacterium]